MGARYELERGVNGAEAAISTTPAVLAIRPMAKIATAKGSAAYGDLAFLHI
jgi:hypothetical protein